MRMAKLQKATLDPTKISGRCGRLKCCLRYEYDTYEQIQKERQATSRRPPPTRRPRNRRAAGDDDAGEAAAQRQPSSRGSRLTPKYRPCSTRPSDRQLLEEDRRYTFDAYVFVFEALQLCAERAGHGQGKRQRAAAPDRTRPKRKRRPQRHVTGQELCEAIRRFALEQYGYMAKTVLNSWGIHGTGDFGEIVFNLIRIGQMRKTPARPPRGFRRRLRFRHRIPTGLPDRDARVRRLDRNCIRHTPCADGKMRHTECAGYM